MSPAPAPEKDVEKKFLCPPPVATHEEVINQPELFFDTLKSLHSFLGTKFMVPVIGRKEVDLHALYIEVTGRGGYDKVVLEKKWKEISTIFNFSPTATSASFVLKKHYLNLLYQYEQVYYFHSLAPVSPAPSARAALPLGRYVCGPDVADHEDCSSKSAHDSPDGVSGSMSIPVVGTIDGKFDCGYLVTVKLGTDVLRGVLYRPDGPPVPSTSGEDLSMAIVPYEPSCSRSTGKKRRRRKRKRWGGDPSHPKPNRSGYNFFFAEKHSTLKSLYPNREREFTKMIGESWNNLTPEERLVYQNIGLRDKERYKRELKEYNERLAALKNKDN
ncbi:hypothetical protein Cgig2_031942 [Carnegiea gigantea]|uniref:High mobility group B protein 9 n=1 Tax=Carnegiea gigantea TaxID=171969 RepID=A0A9Q1K6S6_9CARY|nr:hypothetical protein Cgig2_031942 [Carnegiea gigantea]